MLYGLVDCNNFFVSCEVAFNPGLRGKAVVVLSNNDGCVISRSYEAKALGIPMGCPAFKIKEYTCEQVVQLSSRHMFYQDMSSRIMSILGSEVERLEIFSVDEAFFRMPYDDEERNREFGHKLSRMIYQYVGVPVSIGVAPTHTLAKIASHISKQQRTLTENFYQISSPGRDLLESIPIGDVWGVGRRLTESLQGQHIRSAYDLTIAPEYWVKRHYSITLVRTQKELMGVDCAQVNAVTAARQSIMRSRSFGKVVRDERDLLDAVVNFASWCAKSLRDQHSVAQTITTYVRGDRYNERDPYYANQCTLTLLTPTSSTIEIVNEAVKALRHIYREGFGYKKAGVLISGIKPENQVQLNLFDANNGNIDKRRRLMQMVDKINNKAGGRCVGLVPEQIKEGSQWTPSKSHIQDVSKQIQLLSHTFGL